MVVLRDIVLHKLEQRVAEMVGDIFRIARQEVVHDDDVKALGHESIDEVRTQKARPERKGEEKWR